MIDVTPLKAPFGAEVRGWEPGRALTDSEEEVLRKALHTYVLLVLRGHPRPSNEEFARLGEGFGGSESIAGPLREAPLTDGVELAAQDARRQRLDALRVAAGRVVGGTVPPSSFAVSAAHLLGVAPPASARGGRDLTGYYQCSLVLLSGR